MFAADCADFRRLAVAVVWVLIFFQDHSRSCMLRTPVSACLCEATSGSAFQTNDMFERIPFLAHEPSLETVCSSTFHFLTEKRKALQTLTQESRVLRERPTRSKASPKHSASALCGFAGLSECNERARDKKSQRRHTRTLAVTLANPTHR